MVQRLASILFTLYLFGSVPIYGFFVLLTAPFPHAVTYRAVQWWIDSVLFLLRRLCRLGFEVEGCEHVPEGNTVVLMKHSSAWETLAQFRLFPTQTWVLKRELMWVPFLGWVLRLLKPIAIDRSGGRAAVQQVVEQGRKRLAEGFWVVIFPEGTRVPAGQTRRYGISGALLAAVTGKPIVPVAHNAGEFWPRRGWLKRPGTIRVRIGPPIPTAGRDPREITAEAQRWIEGALAEISEGRAARAEGGARDREGSSEQRMSSE
ncbi:MAG TPA: lysophospholipid acyltransferase family protein [Gammaproteobacteria bacterium]|nr:lysophospholipid acyltransferase family protein [Gammaproteobacteria bacterium]